MKNQEQKLQVTPEDIIAGKVLLAVLEEKSTGELISRQEVLDIANRISGSVLQGSKGIIESFETQSNGVLEHTECAGTVLYRIIGPDSGTDTVTGGTSGTVIKISGLDPFKKVTGTRGEIQFPSVLTMSRALLLIKYIRESGGGRKNDLSSYILGKYYRSAGLDKPAVRTIISGTPAVGYVEEMRLFFDRLFGMPEAITYLPCTGARRNMFHAKIKDLDEIEKKIKSMLGEPEKDVTPEEETSDVIEITREPEDTGSVLPVTVRIKRPKESLEQSFPNIKFEVNLEIGPGDYIYDITVEATKEAETDAVFLFRSLREEDGEKAFNNLGESFALARVFNRGKTVNKLIY